jgi:hypothetical protein
MKYLSAEDREALREIDAGEGGGGGRGGGAGREKEEVMLGVLARAVAGATAVAGVRASQYSICVLIMLHMCPHTTTCLSSCIKAHAVAGATAVAD